MSGPRNVAGSPAREHQQDAAEENKGSEEPSDLRPTSVVDDDEPMMPMMRDGKRTWVQTCELHPCGAV